MPVQPIPFVNDQRSGSEALAGPSPVAMNVVVESGGVVRRRPGIAAHLLAADTVIDSRGLVGLYATADGELFGVGGNGMASKSVYRIRSTGSTNLSAFIAGYSTGDEALQGQARPTFAETEALLVLAAGGPLQRVALDTHASHRLGGHAWLASHVVANSSRLLTNDTATTSSIHYSGQAAGSSITGHETWNPTWFFSAEARPDPIVAVHENTNEVFAFGQTTLQTFAPDANIVYATVGTREIGCSAPYSIIKVDQQFAWLDHRRRIVSSDGRGVEDLGEPMHRVFDDMTTVSDCFGYRVHVGGVDCLVWTFPTDGRTFVYQIGAGWGQWSSWSDTNNSWAAFPVLSHVQRPDDAVNVVGTATGKLGALEFTATDDLGSRIVAYVETGFINRGTDARKICRCVRFTLKRGQSSAEAHASFAYRDDHGAWEPDMPIDLGSAGDYTVTVPFYSLGVYRRRQWRFTFSGSAELVLAGATEEFDVLDR